MGKSILLQDKTRQSYVKLCIYKCILCRSNFAWNTVHAYTDAFVRKDGLIQHLVLQTIIQEMRNFD